MAFNLETPVPGIMFTSEMDVIQWTSTESPVTVRVELQNSGTVFETTLYPLVSGSLVLYDIGKLLDRHMAALSGDYVHIFLNGSKTVSTFAVKSAVLLEIPATQWVQSRYLSSMTEERDTDLSRHETLSCFNPEKSPCNVECTFLSDSDVISRKSFVVTGQEEGHMTDYDVSPSKFAGNGRLIAYAVKTGNRVLRYRVLLNPTPCVAAFVFRNNFGCWETLYCFGERTTEPQYSRSSSLVNGRFDMYDIEETDRVTVSTGVMRFGADRIIRDLARSRSVYLLNSDGTQGEQVVITDCSVKSVNADDFTPQYSFTYRLAHKGASDIDGFKIFDLSFDDTYE